MCGIAGVFVHSPSGAPVQATELSRIAERMAPRGPDGAGQWMAPDARVGLTHRRLAIIDLTAAASQPMWSDCGRFAIVFNGEIYNFRELREALRADGDTFRSQSDTEVLLALFRRHREAMCGLLRGMFAFAILDSEQKELFLARDTFGIKPLYWHDDGTTFRFASQVKALAAGGAIANRLEAAAAAGFVVWGHVPEPWTTVQGVTSLPAGHWMRVAAGRGMVAREFESVTGLIGGAGADAPAYRPDLGRALGDTLRHHLVADVPVGIFLSSGIDSTTIAALLSETGQQARTLTLGFEEYRGRSGDETVLAERVARQYGTEHLTVWLGRRHFEDHLTRLIDQMDQPSIDGVNTYFLAGAAASAGIKVALSGLGGDELFGGYPSFTQVPRLVALLRWSSGVPRLGTALERLSGVLPQSLISPKAAGLLRYGGGFAGAYLLRRALRLPSEALGAAFSGLDRDVVATGLQRLGAEDMLEKIVAGLTDAQAKVSALEASCYMRSQLLRDCDWASMAHSLEVRVPLVDRVLAREISALRRAGQAPTKRQLGLSPRQPLPPEVLNRPKTGFTVPVRDWLMDLEGGRGHAERGLRGWQRFVWRQFLAGAGSGGAYAAH